MRRAITFVLATATVFAVAPTAQAAGLAITSGDGLAMRLGPTGGVERVAVGDRALPLSGSGGFSLRRVGGTPNLVPNSGLETDGNGDGIPDGWRELRTGPVPVLTSSVAHTGSRSARISLSRRADSGSIYVDVPVRPSTPYSIGGWFRTQDLQPTGPRVSSDGFLLPGRINISEVSGTTARWAGNLQTHTDTTSWHRRVMALTTGPSTRALRLALKVVDGSGTIWFDDISVRAVHQPNTEIIGGTVTATGPRTLEQRATMAGGLRLDATYTASADRITVDGRVSSAGTADVPLELSYALPVNAVGWDWHDDARNKRRIGSGGSYSYETQLQPQTTSRYPWSTISDDRSTLSMGIPLDMPRIQRIRYSPAGLRISFDLGLSPRATRLGPVATFRFVIYTSGVRWGFRAATKDYYRMFPDFFVRRTDPSREGGWGARGGYGAWSGHTKDFGIGLDMVGQTPDHMGQANAEILAKDDADGLYSVLYNHHWGYKQGHAVPPTYDEAVQSLRDDAGGPRGTLSERARTDRAVAALRSTPRDLNGEYLYEFYPWEDDLYVQWYEDLDPLPPGRDWQGVSRTYQVDPGVEGAAAAGVELDGLHMDSTSGMRRWAAADDYHPAHWASAIHPLTFSYASAQVTKRILFTDYEQLKRTSAHAHGLGIIFSANFNASDAGALGWFGADVIDYFGIERGLRERATVEKGSTVDSLALLKRSMANQRPVSTLDTLVSDGSLTTRQVEDRIQHNLFYGIYAGIAPGPSLTDAIRRLYLRYTPIFRAINRHGWEPITDAGATGTALLERYGSLEDGVQYFTVRNDTAASTDVTVTFALRGVTGPASTIGAMELVTRTEMSVSDSGTANGTFTITVPADSTRVVRLTTRP